MAGQGGQCVLLRSPDQTMAATISAAPASMRRVGTWVNRIQAKPMA